MVGDIQKRLAAEGIELPKPVAAAANYVPVVREGDLLFVSGQLPIEPAGGLRTGKLGETASLADGQAAARLCAINILAQAGQALEGDLARIRRIVRITGYVASSPEFLEHHLVVNGASDLLVALLADKGRHARAAVGVACLPLDATVEVDAMIAVD